MLQPVRRLALKRLVKLSQGAFTAEMVDELVQRAEAGEVPRGRVGTGAAEPAPSADDGDDADRREPGVGREDHATAASPARPSS